MNTKVRKFPINILKTLPFKTTLLVTSISAAVTSHADLPIIMEKGTFALSPAAQIQASNITFNTPSQNELVATLLLEDFETGGLSWTTEGSWAIGAPTSGPNSGFNSINAAGTNLSGDYSDNANESIVSPPIALPTLNVGESIFLNFNEYYDIESGFDAAIIEVSTDGGSTWANQISTRDGSSGGNWLSTEILLDAFAGQTIQIRFRLATDASVTETGWYLDNVNIEVRVDNNLISGLRTINSQLFPFVFADVDFSADENACAQPVPVEDFTVTEDGVTQTILTFVPPEQSGGIRLADVVFIFDNSGSMGDEQAAVEANIIDFVDGLVDSGVDFALGLTRYGQSELGGDPILEDGGILTTDADYFKDNVLPRNLINGGTEPGYFAITESAEGYAFRPGSQRVFVVITDETPDQGGATITEAAEALELADAQLFAVTSLGLFDEFEPLVDDTTNQLIDILSPFDTILDAIVSDIGSTYRLSYRTTNDVIDGLERTVDISIVCGTETTTASGTYTPGGAPQISLSPEAIETNNTPQVDGVAIPISVEISDQLEPFISSASLFYRPVNGSFQSTPLVSVNGLVFEGEIPASVVSEPGVEYYVTATDGNVSSSLPTVDPISNPFQIAVLPNEAPEIIHTPVAESSPGTALSLVATITDTTNNLVSADLFYRKTGDLTYQVVPMSNDGGDGFSAQIPADVVTVLGVQYYIKAVDDFGVAATAGLADAPLEITVTETSLPACDMDSNGVFEQHDIYSFLLPCAQGTSSFECDLDDNGIFDRDDIIAFRRTCMGSE